MWCAFMEVLVCFVRGLVLVVLGLVSIAFITLMEQKVLGAMQIRVGPVYRMIGGIGQPFADAVKLLNKETIALRAGNILLYGVRPFIFLVLRIALWCCLPSLWGFSRWVFRVLFFIVVRGLIVYPVIFRGWASNCKYRIFGSLRAVAQTISYEIRLFIIVLRIV